MGLSVSQAKEPVPALTQFFGWTAPMIARATVRAKAASPHSPRLTRAQFWEVFTDYSVLRGTSFVSLDLAGYALFSEASCLFCPAHSASGAHVGRFGESEGTADASPDVDVRLVLFFLALACDTTPETQASLCQEVYKTYPGPAELACWQCGVPLRGRDGDEAKDDDGEGKAQAADNRGRTPPKPVSSRSSDADSRASAATAAADIDVEPGTADDGGKIEEAKADHSGHASNPDDEEDTLDLHQWADVIQWVFRAAVATTMLTKLPGASVVFQLACQVADELNDDTLNEEQV